MKKIMVIGATSAIATAVLRLWAVRGDALFLVGRNEERLKTCAADLKVRGASEVQYRVLDFNNTEQQEKIVAEAMTQFGKIDIAFIAHGLLPDQTACENNVQQTQEALYINLLSPIALLTPLANVIEQQKFGTLAVITSVAGDRGRRSNYVYGTAKAALNVFLQGLRHRLFASGGHVVIIKPGFIESPMTVNFKKGALWSTPEAIAPQIVKAIDKNKTEIYTPSYWFWIMQIIKMMPERLFVRTKL